MKKWFFLMILALSLAACSPSTTGSIAPTPVGQVSSPLVTDYPDATSLRNQLALGTLKLEGTPHAVTAEQARTLLPLWQAVASMSGTSTTVSEELNAVQNQILGEMKPEQLQAINALKITNAQLTAFYAEKGITLPTPAPGVTKVPGSGKNVSEADRQATRTAAEASGTAGSGAGMTSRTVLFDSVIALLTERAGK